jgi:hypothetical protein
MAKKLPPPPKDGLIWLDIPAAASRLGTTRRKIMERAWAGEFRFQDDGNGMPIRVADADIAPLRAAKLTAEREKIQAKPRAKTATQQEAEWAKLSADRARASPRGGAFTEHHLRMTLPFPELKKPDDPKG